jgi:hypothetical protein
MTLPAMPLFLADIPACASPILTCDCTYGTLVLLRGAVEESFPISDFETLLKNTYL